MNRYFFSNLDSIPNEEYEIIGTISGEDTPKNVMRLVYRSANLTQLEQNEIEKFLDCYGADALIGIKPVYERVKNNIVGSPNLIVCYMGTLIRFTGNSVSSKQTKKKSIIIK